MLRDVLGLILAADKVAPMYNSGDVALAVEEVMACLREVFDTVTRRFRFLFNCDAAQSLL